MESVINMRSEGREYLCTNANINLFVTREELIISILKNEE